MDDYRTVVGVDDTDLVKVAGMVGADEHREPFVEFFDSDRVLEGVKNDVVGNAVPMGAGGDERLIHRRRIVVPSTIHKLPCDIRRTVGRTEAHSRGFGRPHDFGTSPARCIARARRGPPHRARPGNTVVRVSTGSAGPFAGLGADVVEAIAGAPVQERC